MRTPVTGLTKRDEISIDVAARATSQLLVVDLQILRAATLLAAPMVALENLLSQSSIGLRVQTDPWHLWPTQLKANFRTVRNVR